MELVLKTCDTERCIGSSPIRGTICRSDGIGRHGGRGRPKDYP